MTTTSAAATAATSGQRPSRRGAGTEGTTVADATAGATAEVIAEVTQARSRFGGTSGTGGANPWAGACACACPGGHCGAAADGSISHN